MQNYANHRRNVPIFHFVALPILLINFLWSVYQLWQGADAARIIGAAVAFALIIVGFASRVFALKAQDRLIRLEMRLRLREILPADLQGTIASLTVRQMVGLRFASDAELPSLVAQVLKDNIASSEAIKKMVKDWQADYVRVLKALGRLLPQRLRRVEPEQSQRR